MRPATFVLRGAAAIACLVFVFWSPADTARADSTDPFLVFYADAEKEGKTHTSYPPAAGGFDGPCGLAQSGGLLYVSDHYRNAVDLFSGSQNYLTRLAPQKGFAGPCQLAVAPGGILFVNYYHQGVVRYQPSPFPITSQTTYGPGETVDQGNATGVAVDPVGGRVYVDRREYIAVYDLSGAPVLDGEVPMKLGEGSLNDAYGLAVSNYSTKKGYVYVADAADRKIKVFDPAGNLEQPVATLDGSGTPAGDFVSLKDTAVAADTSTGAVYVVDNLQPSGFERPEAAVYAFDRDGNYDGRFKFNVVHSQPPGLTATGDVVYVTSGNTLGAAIYAYRASALTAAVFPAPEAVVEGPDTSPTLAAAPSFSVQSTSLSGLAASLAAPAEELTPPRPVARHRRRAHRAHKAKRHHRSRARRDR